MTLTRSKSAGLFASKERARVTRGGTTCCVPGCFNNTLEDKTVPFYAFPANLRRRILWLERIGRPQWIPPQQKVLCGNHFVGGNIRTAKGALQDPTIFPRTRHGAKSSSGPRDEERSPRKRRAFVRQTFPGKSASLQQGPGHSSHFLQQVTSMSYDFLSRISLERSAVMKTVAELKTTAEIAREDHCYAKPNPLPFPAAEEITIEGERRTCHKLAELPEAYARLFCASMCQQQGVPVDQQAPLVNAGVLHIQLPPFMAQNLPAGAFLSRRPCNDVIPVPVMASAEVSGKTAASKHIEDQTIETASEGEIQTDLLAPGGSPTLVNSPTHLSPLPENSEVTSDRELSILPQEATSEIEESSDTGVKPSEVAMPSKSGPVLTSLPSKSPTESKTLSSCPSLPSATSTAATPGDQHASRTPSSVPDRVAGSATTSSSTAEMLSRSPTEHPEGRQDFRWNLGERKTTSAVDASNPTTKASTVGASTSSTHSSARGLSMPSNVTGLVRASPKIVTSRPPTAKTTQSLLARKSTESQRPQGVVLSVVEEQVFPPGIVVISDDEPMDTSAGTTQKEGEDESEEKAKTGSDITDFIQRVFID